MFGDRVRIRFRIRIRLFMLCRFFAGYIEADENEAEISD